MVHWGGARRNRILRGRLQRVLSLARVRREMMEGVLVREMSEDEILSCVVPLLPRGRHTTVPNGDDSAVLDTPDGRVTVSTDMLVEGIHFRRDWSSGEDVGWRAAMQNIADAVAMGAAPVSLVVSFELPGDLPVEWVEGLARGIAAACRSCGCGVDGGDLVAGRAVAIGVTILGDLEGRVPLQRSGAQPGQPLIHAGVLGHSMAGLELLQRGFAPAAGFPDAETVFIDDFRRPKPPVAAALRAAAEGRIASFMDVSDGLVRDCTRLAKASGVWIDIDTDLLHDDAQALIEPARHLGMSDPWGWAYRTVLSGGEDHGFLGTLDVPAERAWGPGRGQLPDGFRRIGIVRDRVAGGRVTLDGHDAVGLGGWDHFAR